MPLTPIAVKRYSAILKQESTNNPTAQVLQNTFGTVTWTREDVGYYKGTCTGAFTENKRQVLVTNGGTYQDSANNYIDVFAFWAPGDIDHVWIASEYNGQLADGQADGIPIIIEVYQ